MIFVRKKKCSELQRRQYYRSPTIWSVEVKFVEFFVHRIYGTRWGGGPVESDVSPGGKTRRGYTTTTRPWDVHGDCRMPDWMLLMAGRNVPYSRGISPRAAIVSVYALLASAYISLSTVSSCANKPRGVWVGTTDVRRSLYGCVQYHPDTLPPTRTSSASRHSASPFP